MTYRLGEPSNWKLLTVTNHFYRVYCNYPRRTGIQCQNFIVSDGLCILYFVCPCILIYRVFNSVSRASRTHRPKWRPPLSFFTIIALIMKKLIKEGQRISARLARGNSIAVLQQWWMSTKFIVSERDNRGMIAPLNLISPWYSIHCIASPSEACTGSSILINFSIILAKMV